MLDSRELARFWPSERRAILVHKYYLGVERGYDPSIREAIESWEAYYASTWRETKLRHDAEVQLAEIESFRLQRCDELRREVDFAQAAKEWVENHEPAWRRNWEESACAGA
jgi:hypothetical protein